MGFYNSLVGWFEEAPQEFEPTFYGNEGKRKTFIIVDEWCIGFIKGTRLDPSAWKPLKRECPDLLKPLQLFRTEAGFRELKAGGATKMHTLWSPRITPAVREIHAYWLARRRATASSLRHRMH